MTSARKAALLRFFLWLGWAWIMRSNPSLKMTTEELIAILALFEIFVASSPFLDKEKDEPQKHEKPLDKK